MPPYNRPAIVSGVTKLDKPFFDNLLDGMDERLTAEDANATYAPSKLFTRTYIPTGTAADFAGLQAVIDSWAASGLPGVIRVGAGDLRPEGDGTVGAYRLPADKPGLLIEAAGEAATRFTLSRSVPRLFDLYGTGSGRVFENITVRGFSVDGGAVTPTAIGSTTVTANVTLLPDQYTTVQVASNTSFVGAGTRWASARAGGAGTIAASRMLFQIPPGTTALQLWNTTGSSKTLVAGDIIDGYLYDHVIFGNHNVGSTAGTAPQFKNILVEDVSAENIPTQFVNGLNTFTSSIRFGVHLSAGIGGRAEGIRARNVRINGGECGFSVAGSATSWIDDVDFEDCFHDTGLLPTMNSPSYNFLIGQDAWVGKVRVKNCVGVNSGDVGLEIDQAMHHDVDGLEIRESYSAPFYQTNFVPPARSIAGPLKTTLTASLTNVATSATVAPLPTGFPRRGYAQIGSEVVYYLATSSTALTLVRGMDQSVAAAANSGDAVISVDNAAQTGGYTRCHSVNLQTPGKGWWFNPNHSLPMATVRLRDCTVRSVVTDLDNSQGVLIFGSVAGIDVDGLPVDISLRNTVSQPTGVYSAIRTYRPGETGRNSSIGRPTDVRMRKTRVIIDGSVASSSSQMRPIWFGEGWYAFSDVDVDVRNFATGFANGATSGIFIGGTTTAQVHNGNIALKYVSVSTSDTSPHMLYLNGAVGIMDRINYRLDMSEAYTTTNQIPWNIPSTLRDQLSVELVVPPRLGPTGNATKPAKIYTMTASPYTAKHSDRVILVNMAAAVGTVNLPATNTGNALAVPRPGAGTLVTVKDISGAAATYGITINPAAGETIDGASSKVISTNYGVVHLVSTGTGWAVL